MYRLHHLLFFVLDAHVLEVLPFGKDLHSLDVFNGGQLISVVLVAAQRIEVHFLSKAFVLSLHNLENVCDLLTFIDFVVIDSND